VLRSVLKKKHRALLALGLEGVLGKSGSRKAAASIASHGGGAVLTADRPGLFDIVVLFPLVSLPVAVAPPPPRAPPPCLLCIKRPRLLPPLGPSGPTLLLTPTQTYSDPGTR
jgi:hypothetical protein